MTDLAITPPDLTDPHNLEPIRAALNRAARRCPTLQQMIDTNAMFYISAVPDLAEVEMPPEVALLMKFLPMRAALRTLFEEIIAGREPALFSDGPDFGRAWVLPLTPDSAVRISTKIPGEMPMISGAPDRLQ